MLLMVFAMLSFFWGYLQGVGLYAAIFAGASSVLIGMGLAKTKLRKRMLGFATLIMILGTWALGFSLSYFTIFAKVFGVSFTISLQLIVYGFGFVFAIASLLRALAIRMSSMYALEFWVIAFSAAVAFAPHRNHIVLQPLWLSDFAWTMGLEPTFLLAGVGFVLALMLSVITLLEKTTRFPLVLLFLPLLGIFVFMYVDPTELNTEEPPAQSNNILKDLEGSDPLFMPGGGGGKRDPREETAQGENGEGQEDNESASGKISPVAVVLLETDVQPESQYFYLRQEGLSTYTGTRLVAPRDRDISYDGFIGFPTGPAKAKVLPPEGDERIVIKGTVSLLAPHTAPFGIESLTHYTPTINPRPGMFNRTYAFQSSAQNISYQDLLDYEIGNPDWSAKEWAHFTTPPNQDPRYEELALEIVQKLPPEWRENPFAQALSIKLYLDEKTRYTQRVRHAQAKDPTAEFLFGPKNQHIGYCVHTSHAAVLLWRSLGLPSRIGVGYAVDVQNAKNEGFVVNDVDAHAWPELYIQDVGWIILDIAPAENLDQTGEPPDPALQDSLMELAKDQEESSFREPIDWALLWKQWKWVILSVVLGAGGGIILLHIGTKLYRRFRPKWDPKPRFVYIAALDILSESGIFREEGETPEAFASRVQSPGFVQITDEHVAYALGGPKESKTHILLPNLYQELPERIPFWRRILGMVNPFSFYFSR